MKILFFDLETTGLPSPETQKGTVSENYLQWPRIWQISAVVYDYSNGRVCTWDMSKFIKSYDRLPWISQDGNPVPIKNDVCMADGLLAHEVFPLISDAMHDADLIVCHNLAFDSRVFESECYRLREMGYDESDFRMPPKKSDGKPKICTMNSSSKHCAIPKANGKGLKWPTLQELHEVLFKKKYHGAHDSRIDVMATIDCFQELVRLGVIDLGGIKT